MPPAGSAASPRGELPFVLTSVGDTVIAVEPCGCSLLVPGYPVVVAMHRVPIDRLMRIAGVRFAGHSRQRFRVRALHALTQIEDVPIRARAARRGPLTVRLAGPRGDTTIRVATAGRRTSPAPVSPVWPRPLTIAGSSVTAEVRGPIAILRIPLMLDRADTLGGELGYRMVRAAMERESFRASRALIIDVRGNDGGTRHILEYLVPHFTFRPDGRLYDGVGIAPDILAPWTLDGVATGRDVQMATALRYLLDRVGSVP